MRTQHIDDLNKSSKIQLDLVRDVIKEVEHQLKQLKALETSLVQVVTMQPRIDGPTHRDEAEREQQETGLNGTGKPKKPEPMKSILGRADAADKPAGGDTVSGE